MPRKRTLEEEAPGAAVAVAELPEVETPAVESAPKVKRLSIDDYGKMSMWEAMAQMNEDDWSNKMLYVYRSAPFTVNKHTNQKYGSIFKGGTPGITQEELQNNFGGGKFRLYLKQGKVTLCDAHQIVDGKPKLLPDELLMTGGDDGADTPAPTSDPNSQMALEVIRELLQERKDKAAAQGDVQQVSAINSAIGLMSQASERANKLVADANKAPSLNEQFDLVQKVMALAAPKEDKTMMILLSKLLERAFPAQAAPTANPAQQLKESVETLKSLKELWGEAEGAASGDWKTTLVAALVPAVPQIIGFLRQAANRPPQVIVMQPGPDGRFHAVPQRATPQTLETVPIEQPPGVEVESHSRESGNPPPAPGGPTGPPTGGDLLAGDSLKLKVVTMFLKGNDGSLVASFIENAAPTVYAGLRQIDAQLFPGFLKNDPILSQIATEAPFEEWCKEFLEFMHEEEEDGAPEAPPATPAAPPVQ